MNLDQNSPEKIFIQTLMFNEVQTQPFRWCDIKHFAFQDEDLIYIDWDPSDDAFEATIYRMVEETDEEFNERQLELKENEEKRKANRQRMYLKLKEEFENESSK